MTVSKKKNYRLSATALAVSAAILATLSAQSQAQQTAPGAVEEISVTGTRIRTTDGMVTPTPVTAVTTSEIKNLNPAAAISEQLDKLPQFLNTQTAQRGGGTLFGDAAGSYLNLRNMGKQRTLVLIDGIRTVPADRAGTINVDDFPTALIKSIDVVTGGASAAYGADAMSGVVNFVLDREFQGFKSSFSTGISDRKDGENYNFSVAGGIKVGNKLHLTGSIENRFQKMIERQPWELDNWRSIGWVTNPAYKAADPAGTNPKLLTVPDAYAAIQNAQGIVTTVGGTPGSVTSQFKYQGYTFTDDGKSMRALATPLYKNLGNSIAAGGPEAATQEAAYNGGPFGAEVIQRSGFGGFKYDLTDATQLFGQVIMGRTESNTYNRRGNPEMGNTYNATIYRDNAFLPPELATEMDRLGLTSLRFDKIGQVRTATNYNFYDRRTDYNISQMWSGSVGFDHQFANDWTLRGTYQYGKSKLTSEADGIIRVDNWYLALDTIKNPTTGAIQCYIQKVNPTMAQLQAAAVGKTVLTTRITQYPTGLMPIDNVLVTPTESINNCVPTNFFGLGNTTPEADKYMTSTKKGYRDYDQNFGELLLSGNLSKGWGAGAINFAAGATYRKEWFNQITVPVDFERTTVVAPEVGIRGIGAAVMGGNRSIHQFSATSWATGDFNVSEEFAEVNVPIWTNGNQRVDSNLAFRRSDYSRSGGIDSWKYGAEFMVSKELRIRGTQSRDVREPTFQEQYESGGGGSNITDPKFATNAPNYTVTILTLGNPELKPEVADTQTLGFVWSPSYKWLDGFQLSADYYNIDVAKRITPLGAQRLIDECFSGLTPSLCAQVFRDGGTGRITRVDDKQVNAAAGVTSGIDFEARYEFEPDFFKSMQEKFKMRLFANHMQENSVTTGVINSALARKAQPGFKDDSGSLTSPKWNATATFGYDLDQYSINWIMRYYGKTNYTNGFGTFWKTGFDVDDATIQSQTVNNVVFSYHGQTKSGGSYVASFNVNNIFDRDPSVTASQNLRGGQQGVSNVFDVFGRRYQFSMNYSF